MRSLLRQNTAFRMGRLTRQGSVHFARGELVPHSHVDREDERRHHDAGTVVDGLVQRLEPAGRLQRRDLLGPGRGDALAKLQLPGVHFHDAHPRHGLRHQARPRVGDAGHPSSEFDKPPAEVELEGHEEDEHGVTNGKDLRRCGWIDWLKFVIQRNAFLHVKRRVTHAHTKVRQSLTGPNV